MNPKYLPLLEIALLSFMLFPDAALSAELQHLQYQEKHEAFANPLKGWVIWGENHITPPQPTTLFFSYRSQGELEPEEGKFDFESWENEVWQHWTDQGMKAIFRVHLDYPGRPIGIPRWLLDAGVSATQYEQFGGGWSLDYEHPLFLEKIRILIAKLGERYDHDPRVAFLDVGILGHWGEWHTYPTEHLFASLRVQREITRAFSSAFKNKKMMLRTPSTWKIQEPFGYRDDCFYYQTEGSESWYFLTCSNCRNRSLQIWQTQPIGGEFVTGGGAIDATLRSGKCFRLIRGAFLPPGPAGGSMQSRNVNTSPPSTPCCV